MYIRKTNSNDFDLFTPAYHDVLEAQAMGIEPKFPDASECVTLDHGGFPRERTCACAHISGHIRWRAPPIQYDLIQTWLHLQTLYF